VRYEEAAGDCLTTTVQLRPNKRSAEEGPLSNK
jgi:hypothetical protein